jgi:hypothetical protein
MRSIVSTYYGGGSVHNLRPRPHAAQITHPACHLEGDALDLVDLLHELGGGGLAGARGGVGVRHAELALDAVLAARRDGLVRRLHVVEDA